MLHRDAKRSAIGQRNLTKSFISMLEKAERVVKQGIHHSQDRRTTTEDNMNVKGPYKMRLLASLTP